MFYDRKIKYFDYMEHGERLRNGGFVKLEVRDAVCNITLQISGLHTVANNTYQVYLLSGERKEVLCNILLSEGKGDRILRLQSDNLCGGISYEQLEAIQIPIYQTKELTCRIREKACAEVRNFHENNTRTMLSEEAVKKVPAQVVIIEAVEEAKAAVDVEDVKEAKSVVVAETVEKAKTATVVEDVKEAKTATVVEDMEEAKAAVVAEDVKEAKTADVAEDTEKAKFAAVSEDVGEVRETISPEANRQGKERPLRNTVPLMEDKWKQLAAVYPHITPFHDAREYLSIGPGDFVIMSQKYYKLVNNSFLLHGFYNYKHLILTRMEKRGEMYYYIGVPGNFYEREKQVALMFGFESFECLEEPANSGDFGYYMIRVEI